MSCVEEISLGHRGSATSSKLWLIGESLDPILTDNLPAPLGLIELSVCACKGDSSNNRCKCYKNKFVCTDMCKCSHCSNDDVHGTNNEEFDTDSDISDLDDEDNTY